MIYFIIVLVSLVRLNVKFCLIYRSLLLLASNHTINTSQIITKSLSHSFQGESSRAGNSFDGSSVQMQAMWYTEIKKKLVLVVNISRYL